MAESYNTLAGLVQLNDKNLADLNISDILDGAPLLKIIYSQVASDGTVHKYLKTTTNPSAAFRDALDGVVHTASAETLVTDVLKIFDASFDTDVALAKGYVKGVDAWLMREQAKKLRAKLAAIEKQIFYGVAADSKGFVGLVDNAQLDALADAMVVGAGGTNVSTQTSCFMLRHGADGVSLIIGNDGLISVEDPTIIQKAGSASGTYPAWFVASTGYLGFQIGGARSAARIANIECADLTSTSAFTDQKLMAAYSKFPADGKPNVICMNSNAQLLLWNSRTAVNGTGAPAALPTDFMGVPIVVTDQILSTEAVET